MRRRGPLPPSTNNAIPITSHRHAGHVPRLSGSTERPLACESSAQSAGNDDKKSRQDHKVAVTALTSV